MGSPTEPWELHLIDFTLSHARRFYSSIGMGGGGGGILERLRCE